MKHITLLLLALICLNLSYAQEEAPKKWTRSGDIGLNFSQSHLSNWAAGGDNALNWQGIFNYNANYAHENNKWDNNISLALGYSHLGDAKAIKTDDKIELNSLYGYKATEKLFYSLAFSFKTQFADGFDYKNDSTNRISGFMVPAYATLGLGLEYVPNANFSINFAPLTGRITIVNDQDMADAGAFGVDPAEYDEITGDKINDGKTTRFEFGAKMTAKLDVKIAENVSFNSKLELFSDYLKNPQNIDVDWQNLITMKVNSWLNANITAHLIYDDDIMITDKDGNIGPRTQFKEVLSIGLSYKF
ncbi:MAG: DUF3078 domain-containing protein [Bacteroidales bacterium]|jgi:hypothetical protein|nr:DUF3078 domain-containing protein [Bacteroidales bacterium]MDD4085757.1 DUF3078 domain-containing protein [Bacteroidales bacterium]MDY0084376.1 DUF3078 domain-containing protein [Bacteroidales bacterium]